MVLTKYHKIIVCLIIAFLSFQSAYSFFFINSRVYKDFEKIEFSLYSKAITEYENGDFYKAKQHITQISDLFARIEYLELYLNILKEKNNHTEIIEFIERLPDYYIFQYYQDFIDQYILAYIFTVRKGNIAADSIKKSRFLEIFDTKKVNDELKKAGFLSVVYYLFKNELYDEVLVLNELFRNIFQDLDYYYVLSGVAYYFQGDFEKASTFLSKNFENFDLKKTAVDFLSLINYLYDEVDFEKQELAAISELALFNLCLKELESNNIDEVSVLSNEFSNTLKKNLISLFIAYESRLFRTCKLYLDRIDHDLIRNSSLLTLIKAEAEYSLGNYREAEMLFKDYQNFSEADLNYANHSIGYSFKGYYRFNNTAYYWIKNLTQNEKNFYDSLAVYNLSRLYTFTENYHIAINYYDMYNAKYTFPDDAEFINGYLKTLYRMNLMYRFVELFEEFEYILSLSRRFEYLIKIGQYYYNRQLFDFALDFFLRAKEIKSNDELSFKIERIFFTQGKYKDSADFLLNFLKNNPQSVLKNQIMMDLAKYYFNQKLYSNVISISYEAIDEMEEYTQQDSFYYFIALSEKELGNSKKSLGLFFDIFARTENDFLRDQAEREFDSIARMMKMSTALSVLEEKLSETDDLELQNFLLLSIARIYEENRQFNQANLVYYSLVNDFIDSDTLRIYYNIAVNKLYENKYSEALEIIEKISLDNSIEPELKRDVIYLKYIAHLSIGETSFAKHYLLVFYRIYIKNQNDYMNNYNIIRELARLFEEEGQHLFAYHFLSIIKENASKSQFFLVENDYRRLKEILEPELLYMKFYHDFDEVVFEVEELIFDFFNNDDYEN